jgi:hypothetical protein
LGISHLRNCFGHDVILCFTRLVGKKNQTSGRKMGGEGSGGSEVSDQNRES